MINETSLNSAQTQSDSSGDSPQFSESASSAASVYGDTTIFDCFTATAARITNRPFLRIMPGPAAVWGVDAGDISYGEMATRVTERREVLAAADLQSGMRVGLYLYNGPDFFVNWLALNALGLSIVPINPDLQRRELSYIIAHSEMRLMIAAAGTPSILDEVCRDENVPIIGPDAVPPATGDANVDVGGMNAGSGSRTEAALLYTSGTTGQPKGCQLDQVYFLNAGDWYATLPAPFDLRTDTEIMLTPLPMFHMNALAYSVMAMITTGGTLVPLDRFHPAEWHNVVAESGATILHYLGVLPSILMKMDPVPTERAHKVRFGFGAGVDRQLHAPFEERFGFPLLEAWAMTETGAGVCIAASSGDRHVGTSCFGKAEPEIEARIVDDDGKDVGDGEPGELLVRRAGSDPRFGFFSAYLKDAAATDAAWQDGWFHTGDIVIRDADGYFFFRDRKKNIIRRSGENIAAVEVETALMRHPAVASIAVGPVTDPLREQEVACLVVPKAGLGNPVQMTELFDGLFALARAELAYFKAPGWFAAVEAMPLTGTQKLQRGVLQDQLSKMLEAGSLTDYRPRKSRRAPAG